MNDINKELTDCIDNGFLVRCKNKNEVIDVLRILQQCGYVLGEYPLKLLSGDYDYSSLFPNIGLYNGVVNCLRKTRINYPVVNCSDIVSDVYNDCEISEDESNDMSVSLLRE